MNSFIQSFSSLRYAVVLRNFMYNKWAIFLFLCLSIAFKPNIAVAGLDGSKIFKQNCTACHTATDAKLIGPGLKGISTRRKEPWLLKWIKDSQALIKSGDADAKAVFNEYQVQMPPQNLSDEEIKAVLTYLTVGDAAADKKAVTTTAVTTETPSSFLSDSTLTYVLLVVIIFLILIIYALKNAKKAIKLAAGIIDAADNMSSVQCAKVWMTGHKKFVAVVVIIFVLFGVRSGWNALLGIGVSQGYTPEQPIKFSHKIHAGQNGIDCQYCHSGASKGKTSGIPSANVCMNCHKYIQEGSVTGKVEIAKIYKALDYDPATGKYGNKPSPIQWVRIHNLPDLAYFNHSQHVKVGKIVCQECHGKVEEMDVVEQYAPLTMGWCINCHRTTEVKMEGNDYYQNLHTKLAEKYKGQKITVDKIGGLDCAKCHY